LESQALQRDIPDALAVEMECAAIAQVCHDYGVPFAALDARHTNRASPILCTCRLSHLQGPNLSNPAPLLPQDVVDAGNKALELVQRDNAGQTLFEAAPKSKAAEELRRLAEIVAGVDATQAKSARKRASLLPRLPFMRKA
jgi:hypothetical protein